MHINIETCSLGWRCGDKGPGSYAAANYRLRNVINRRYWSCWGAEMDEYAPR
jgi:hypothetical protein